MIALISALLGVAPQLLGLFGKPGSGPPPSVSSEAISVIESGAIDYANFSSGQAVVLGSFTEGGQPGTIVVVKNGGSAAQALGL